MLPIGDSLLSAGWKSCNKEYNKYDKITDHQGLSKATRRASCSVQVIIVNTESSLATSLLIQRLVPVSKPAPWLGYCDYQHKIRAEIQTRKGAGQGRGMITCTTINSCKKLSFDAAPFTNLVPSSTLYRFLGTSAWHSPRRMIDTTLRSSITL
jgi:hypothetical protein